MFILAFVLSFLVRLSFGQSADTPYQTSFAANLNIADSVIHLAYDAASGTSVGVQQPLCGNLYAIDPSTFSVIACCSSLLQKNSLMYTPVKSGLLNGGSVPATNSTLVYMMASIAQSSACAAHTVGTGGNALATGIIAWMTTFHAVPRFGGTTPVPTSTVTYTLSKTGFTLSTLSAAQLSTLNSECATVTSSTARYCGTAGAV